MPGQYTSLKLTEHLALEDIRPSIGSVGDAYDNALMETINGLFKAECIRTTVFHDGPYKSLADVEYATAGWVDWYNNRRLHSTLAMATPVEHEQSHEQYTCEARHPQARLARVRGRVCPPVVRRHRERLQRGPGRGYGQRERGSGPCDDAGPGPGLGDDHRDG